MRIPVPAAYRQVALESAPPRRLLVALYARLHADVAEAGRAITAGDPAARERAVDHALAILVLLEAGLDHPAAPQLCANLAAVYAFAFACILTASVERDSAPLALAERVLRPVSEAYREVIEVALPAAA